MDNKEFFEALAILEKEKGISEEYLLGKIKNAIVAAVRRDYGSEDNVLVDIDPAGNRFAVSVLKTVVEGEPADKNLEISLAAARKIDKEAAVEGQVPVSLETKEFGRIAAQTAKHVIRQGIREAERSQVFNELQSKSQEILTGRVLRVDPVKNVVVGDREGRVGFGFGKANEVSDAIRKGGDAAKKDMMRVKLSGKTIPHEVIGACDGGRVLLKPAPDGTGLIVGGGMRPVLEAAGVRDAVGKSLGSKNRLNVVKATVDALNQLRTAEEISAARA
jgi:N utilization substance protein A